MAGPHCKARAFFMPDTSRLNHCPLPGFVP